MPRSLKYSPDGSQLAFGGEIDGDKATWVFEPATGDLRKVHDERFAWLSWSPDGLSIAGLQISNPDQPLDLQVVTIAASGDN